ncbi:cytochrome P450, partial [Streptomyces sp. SID6648]|nr:cytochrome P450 [Streptomyces sp. SID6648]
DLSLAADPAELRWRGGLIMRGLRTLPVSFTPSASSAGNGRASTQT